MIFELHPPQAPGRCTSARPGTTPSTPSSTSAFHWCSAGRRGAGLLGACDGHQACSSSPSSTLIIAWKPSSGRPDRNDDAVTYVGLDVFATPAADLVTQLRQRWTTVPSKLRPRVTFAYMTSVAAVDPRYAWAIGEGNHGSFIEKWNGTTWQQLPNPNP